jgi:hypothetical protein
LIRNRCGVLQLRCHAPPCAQLRTGAGHPVTTDRHIDPGGYWIIRLRG